MLGVRVGEATNPGPGRRRSDRPVQGRDVTQRTETEVATCVDSDSDAPLMSRAVSGQLLDALELDLMQPVVPKRRVRRVFDAGSEEGIVRSTRGRFQALTSDSDVDGAREAHEEEFDLTIADSPDQVPRLVSQVEEEVLPTQWESGADFSLVRGSGFTSPDQSVAQENVVSGRCGAVLSEDEQSLSDTQSVAGVHMRTRRRLRLRWECGNDRDVRAVAHFFEQLVCRVGAIPIGGQLP